MDDFKLINMNGRVYDPVLGRFLSADPVLQFPENSQNYNKYSYVMNNPMRYVDPSGYEMSEWQFQAMMYMHSRSWQRYLNECGITGMDDFAYGMGVEAGMEALIHSITPKGPGVNEDDGPPDADELEDRTLGGSGDGDPEGDPDKVKTTTVYTKVLIDKFLFTLSVSQGVTIGSGDIHYTTVNGEFPMLTFDYSFGFMDVSIIPNNGSFMLAINNGAYQQLIGIENYGMTISFGISYNGIYSNYYSFSVKPADGGILILTGFAIGAAVLQPECAPIILRYLQSAYSY